MESPTTWPAAFRSPDYEDEAMQPEVNAVTIALELEVNAYHWSRS
jgi:hypothetical protein